MKSQQINVEPPLSRLVINGKLEIGGRIRFERQKLNLSARDDTTINRSKETRERKERLKPRL